MERKQKESKKIDYICRNSVVQQYLTVDMHQKAARDFKNIRTMFELYSLDMLNAFHAVFDVEDFKNYLSSRLGWYFSLSSEKQMGFMQEAIEMCNRNGGHIPIMAYLKCYLFYKSVSGLKKCLQNNSFIKKNIYYKFNIDVFLKGAEKAKLDREHQGNNI